MKDRTRRERALVVGGTLAVAGWLLFVLLTLLGGDSSMAHAASAELRVCSSGCTYTSIQAAVDAANYGDVIKVAEGTYTDLHVRSGLTQVIYITQALTLRGGYTITNWTTPHPDTQPTMLDAQGRGRVICISTAPHVPIEITGFRITGGDAAGLGGDPWGGDAGGGVYVNGSQTTLNGNYIYGNAAYNGGGLFANHRITLTGNVLMSNTAGSGGALYFADFDVANLDGNLIISNTATLGDGGGIMANNGDVILTNNVVADNRLTNAPRRGAGLYVYGTTLRMLHTTIARNGGGDGSGLYVNDPGMPGTQSAVAMTNTIVASHTLGIVVTERNTATLNATLWHANTGGNWSGTGAITHTHDHSGDPAFAADGYHLTFGSAAIDKGVSAGVSTDIDGQARPNGGYDLGADEFFIVTPAAVTLEGPTQGKVGTSYTFTATVSPSTTIPPVTYTWEALGHSPVVRTAELSGTFPFTWTTWGSKTVTVTVENAGSTTIVSDTFTIQITPYRTYLPIVLR
ncbi:MAG: right-handed parallel beta-helix repeat-containing protein [Anaerolineae bacterium]